MRLTVYSDYSLRVLMYLAVHPGRRSTIPEIAGSYGISKNHVMKVAYQLGVAGYIATVRGKNGGLELGKDPREISLGELIRHTEPDLAWVPCFAPVNAACVISPECRLRRALHEAQTAFLAVLDGYTLSDLVENHGRLQELLARGPSPAVLAADRMLAPTAGSLDA